MTAAKKKVHLLASHTYVAGRLLHEQGWCQALEERGMDAFPLGPYGVANLNVERLVEVYVDYVYPQADDELPQEDPGARRLIVLQHTLDRAALGAMLALEPDAWAVFLFLRAEDRRACGKPACKGGRR